MDPKTFFQDPQAPAQRRYESLRAFYCEDLTAMEAARKFGYTESYFKKLRFEFAQSLNTSGNPFFPTPQKGPKQRNTPLDLIHEIVSLRKQNLSIQDINVILAAKDHPLSLNTIDQILKDEGFAPLPKRTRKERLSLKIPAKLEAPICAPLTITKEEFSTETGAGPLIFLPLIERLGLIPAIQNAGFPDTSVLSDASSILSFLALKLLGNERLSHDESWNLDRALGLFAGLNVLPKSATLSSYSYRVSRESNYKLLKAMSMIFQDTEGETGEFNLDFTAIPHWGDASVLEKNWSGSRNKAIKSLLALIVQDPVTGQLIYSDAEIRHRDESQTVLEFVDFWKESRGVAPKMLIFDSKFTTYGNLNTLDKSPEKIRFLTLRRRGSNLLKQVGKLPESEWQKITIEEGKRKYRNLRVHDGTCKLRGYEGPVRQIIITGHGRENPTFLITNDQKASAKELVVKYARRWLVEQEIAEQVNFFHLNQASSSIVVKVDFDLTLSLLAHNLYQILKKDLPGFEKCTVKTISQKFLENGAQITVEGGIVKVFLKKKSHLPILFELPWMKEATPLKWHGFTVQFSTAAFS